ncbi:MAG: hypothetical protein WEC75_07600 [Dehalococcoidia bacterium]
MAVAAPAAGARETVRQKRERDQELLVWPDLVFVEFICSVLFTITFVALSTYMNAPLLNRANASITPNPSKAPWYFMNLQELLLHMDPGLAGVIVPTILLVGLMAVPYIDRKTDGQGGWFATPNAVRITAFSFVYSSLWIVWLILWDNGSHVRVYERLPMLYGSDRRLQWPGEKTIPGEVPAHGALQALWDFIFLPNRVAIRETWQWSLPVPFQPGNGPHDGRLNWPEDFRNVPLPFNGTWIWHWDDPGWMPGWLRRVYPYNTQLDIPEITVQFVLPIVAMVGLPALMVLILVKLGWAHTTRDAMISLFTGFILVYVALTVVGVAFRGKDQDLVPFWKVPNLEKDPSIYRQLPVPPSYGLVDMAAGLHA